MREIKVALRALGFEPTVADMRQLANDYDIDNKGEIDFGKFLEIIKNKIVEKDDAQDISKAFRLFDQNDTGKITLADLKRAANLIGEDVTDEELQEMIDEADKNGNGEVNENEFFRVIRKTNII